MTVSRRALLSGVSACGVALAFDAFAETAQYIYDAQGRLVRIAYSSGATIDYVYDAAGNRTQVLSNPSGQSPPSGGPFVQTIAVSGAGTINLRALADAAGYTGSQDATLTFVVNAGVTVTGPAGGIGIDTGVWPTTLYTIALTLQISGAVYGGGGHGGDGADTISPATAGAPGGDAIFCRAPITIVVNSGGAVKAGGGGGGGGGTLKQFYVGEYTSWNGGGGGGGFPNGVHGVEGRNADHDVAAPGVDGTTAGGGAGGSGGSTGQGTRATGSGGAGGNAGANGANGAAVSGSGGLGTWTVYPPANGGAAGYAIRKNGNTVSVTNNGTITGIQG